MEVVNPRAALLSNFEVLVLLQEQEREHLERAKAAIRVKKEEDVSGTSASLPSGAREINEVCENLRTVEVETIQYLSAEYQPTASQTALGITKLLKDIAPYDLTKAEKLQVVNLAPTEPVELYVAVEELEDRLKEKDIEDILAHVRSSLKPRDSSVAAPSQRTEAPIPQPVDDDMQLKYPEWDAYLDVDGEGEEFDDTGEGTGIDGDLEMNDE